ncbi:MAG: hypothetical protein KDA21_02995 [Phycisphaerales bacterium]|nr:hypothetical protein [Phycisphaerales bacterium]
MNSDQRHHDPSEPPCQLSPAGQARRGAMLAELTMAMDRRHARRATARRVAGSGALLILLATAILIGTRTPAPAPPPLVHHPSPPEVTSPVPSTASDAPAATVMVATDPSVLDRYALTDAPAGTTHIITTSATTLACVRYLDDTALLTTLDGLGRPSGLIRIQDRVVLTSAVIDHDGVGM